jgi:hypothetical protein
VDSSVVYSRVLDFPIVELDVLCKVDELFVGICVDVLCKVDELSVGMGVEVETFGLDVLSVGI